MYKELKTKKLSLKNKVFKTVHPRSYIRGIIRRHHFHSSHLNNSRDIDIYLPPSYEFNKNKRYPVLYMHDGNNLFYREISFGGVPWKANLTTDMMINNRLMEEIIIVGIHNTYQRTYEYTWSGIRHHNGQVEGGGGDRYAKFLVEELKPFIDYHFRSLPDRNNTAIMGSSLGGLISFYLGLYYPHVFSKIGVISPSFWWGKGSSFTDVRRISPALKIWLDMGTREGGKVNGENFNISLIRYMKYNLMKHGYAEGYNLGYLEDRGGKHNEHSWGNRLHLPLLFFFGKRKSLIFS